MFEGKERKYSRHYRCNCKDRNHGHDKNHHRDYDHRHHEHEHHCNRNSIYDAKCLYRCVQPPSNVNNNCNNYYNCGGCECDYYSMTIFNSDRGSVRQV